MSSLALSVSPGLLPSQPLSPASSLPRLKCCLRDQEARHAHHGRVCVNVFYLLIIADRHHDSERYRELIDAADTIVHMAAASALVNSLYSTPTQLIDYEMITGGLFCQ